MRSQAHRRRLFGCESSRLLALCVLSARTSRGIESERMKNSLVSKAGRGEWVRTFGGRGDRPELERIGVEYPGGMEESEVV